MQAASQKYKERQKMLLDEAARARQIAETRDKLVASVTTTKGVDPLLLTKCRV